MVFLNFGGFCWDNNSLIGPYDFEDGRRGVLKKDATEILGPRPFATTLCSTLLNLLLVTS